MRRVLVISSMVARGHVGLSAIMPVLHALGIEATALPTVLLSNHPGHGRFAGQSIPVDQLSAMRDALDANGWLTDVDAVLTGYFPSAEHVDFAAETIRRIRSVNAGVHVCCDPVLGDDPGGLYVSAQVAEAVKRELLPLSRSLTPNRFELEWLSGKRATSPSEAVRAARAIGVPLVLATSIPNAEAELATLAVEPEHAWQTSTQRRRAVPHGTGDALSAAFLASVIAGSAVPQALANASGMINGLIAASVGANELQLVSTRAAWASASPAAIVAL